MVQGRDEFIKELAGSYGIDDEILYALADLLGESEDQDGLITAVEDLTNYGEIL